MASLYIHIPFCLKKCAYCDFASFAGRNRDMARYLSAMEREMELAAGKYGRFPVETVFIGGGTPSLLSGEQIRGLMDHVGNCFGLSACSEITMEANPGTITFEQLRAYRQAGINRLSLGIQAAQNELLALLGRIHRFDEAQEAVRMARDAGFENISIDLMYALPHQTMEDWRETLAAAMGLNPEHISCYSLIVEPGTPLHAKIERGELAVPDDEIALAMQHATVEWLARGGYMRYEISNYAKPGYESAHNTVYWMRGDYLGIGCGAHSLMKDERFENSPDLDAYLNGEMGMGREALSLEAQRDEAVMLETRMTRGLDLTAYRQRYGEDFYSAHRKAIEKLRALDLVEIRGGYLSLTPRGLDIHNAVVVELLMG